MDIDAVVNSDYNPDTDHAFSDSSIGGGLIALGILALASILSTVGLIVFITYRIVAWRKFYRTSIANNQYILLILSLLVADLIQALSFVISFYWYGHQPIGSSRHWCTAQGVMIHLGDVASAFFVLAIALHTFYQVGMGRKVDDHTFAGIIAFVWGLSIVLTVIAPAMHTGDVYIASGAWCWIDEQYEGLRLGTHYVFIFLIEFAGLLIYGVLFLKLRRSRNAISKMSPTYDSMNDKRINHAARLMAIYPVIYMVLTAPLAISRMAVYGNATVPEWTWIMAGCLMTSSGWVDSLLYAFTRRALLKEDFRRPSLGGESWGGSRKPSHTNSELDSLKWRTHSTLVEPYALKAKYGQITTAARSVDSLGQKFEPLSPAMRPQVHIRAGSNATTTTITTLSTMKKLPATPDEAVSIYNDESPILANPTSSPFSMTATTRYPSRMSSQSPNRSNTSRSGSRTRFAADQSSALLQSIMRKASSTRSRPSRANSPVAELPADTMTNMNIIVEKEVQVESQPREEIDQKPVYTPQGPSNGAGAVWTGP